MLESYIDYKNLDEQLLRPFTGYFEFEAVGPLEDIYKHLISDKRSKGALLALRMSPLVPYPNDIVNDEGESSGPLFVAYLVDIEEKGGQAYPKMRRIKAGAGLTISEAVINLAELRTIEEEVGRQETYAEWAVKKEESENYDSWLSCFAEEEMSGILAEIKEDKLATQRAKLIAQQRLHAEFYPEVEGDTQDLTIKPFAVIQESA